MQSTTEMTPTETLIDDAERQRRLLRRAAWAGVTFVAVAILVVVGHPLYVRWQLRQHGWELGTSTSRGLPDWVPQWANPWFGRIDHVSLYRAPPRLGDLERLRRLPDIESITFSSTYVPDSAIEKFSQLPNLTRVEFKSVRVESAGLRYLATSPKLVGLFFFETALDDSGIENISTCPNIKQLWFTKFTDDNIKHLSPLKGLNNLILTNSQLTDDGARRLADEFPQLKTLSIRGPRLSDAALVEFARLSKLRALQLRDMPITDDGILVFKSCPTLELLSLESTRVTSAGANELRKSVSNLHVETK